MLDKHINNNEAKLVPIRIKQARIAREYTLEGLAANIGVSKQMISKYESSLSKPDMDTIIKLSHILDFPIEFFYKPLIQEIATTSPVFFRSAAIPKKTQDAMEQKIDFAHEIVSYIENYIELPMFENDMQISNLLYTDNPADEIEEISTELRKRWGLEDKPISNLTNLLLRKGFIITRSYNNNIKIDAYSKFHMKPYVILGSDKNCCVRSRFDLAHELGHSIMHYHDISSEEKKKHHKILESCANRFASAFLLPANSFAKDIYSITLENFINLKRKWKVSISAMIRRCYDLRMMDEFQYTSLNKSLSVRGWKQREPFDDDMDFETPNLFKQAFDLLLSKNIVSADECIRDIAINPLEIENICFLEHKYFQQFLNDSPKPRLKIISNN